MAKQPEVVATYRVRLQPETMTIPFTIPPLVYTSLSEKTLPTRQQNHAKMNDHLRMTKIQPNAKIPSSSPYYFLCLSMASVWWLSIQTHALRSDGKHSRKYTYQSLYRSVSVPPLRFNPVCPPDYQANQICAGLNYVMLYFFLPHFGKILHMVST